jgi:2-keto-4-pentenoate hydratase/2-oxohepta-3-ene-1,7-dioic acid hydratase in catechol pathway
MATLFDKIICVGKNYLDHAKELGDAVPEEPLFFFKPSSSLVTDVSKPVVLPKNQGSIHHECEIVYRVKGNGASALFDAVTLGLDLTLRDLQNELKKKGQPWEAAKAFPRSAIIGKWIALAEFPDHLRVPFELKVNGETRQKSTGDQMRRTPSELLKKAAEIFDVCDGDLFFSGTPAGVGPIKIGDTLKLVWADRLHYFAQF